MLKAVHIPAGIQKIGVGAFSGTGSLSTVTFEENSALVLIDESAFEGSGLTKIEIPASKVPAFKAGKAFKDAVNK